MTTIVTSIVADEVGVDQNLYLTAKVGIKVPEVWVGPSGSETQWTGGGGGSGTVTTASVVSANGFAGTVATPTTTPAITLSTSVTGVLKGTGTAIAAATAGTDYQAPLSLTTTGSSGAATLVGSTINIPQYTGGGGSGITRSVNSISTTTTGAATANTDYVYFCTGTFTYTQPTAVGNTNEYTIKNVSTGFITITGTSGQTFDGATTLTLGQNVSYTLLSDNSNWNIKS